MKKILTLEIHRFPFNNNIKIVILLFNRWRLVSWEYYPITGTFK